MAGLTGWMSTTTAPWGAIFIRLAVGAVFLSEGIQKFLYASELGAGRFQRIGLPYPDLLGPTVGLLEIVCGSFVLLGLWTRAAAIPLIVVMITAIATTKYPLFAQSGAFWRAAHESRTDWAMLLGSLFLLFHGAGTWSVDGGRR
jgi:uncharacterized membrane protein YphA (DoxX/SURF4 family)